MPRYIQLPTQVPFRLFLASILSVASAVQASDSLCQPLKAFVTSVKPDESRELTFHTIWGSNFKDASETAIYAKRCNHGDYLPARQVCDYLMEHGALEFAHNNVKDALACLSPETRIADGVTLGSASFSFSIGTKNRGSLITIAYYKDLEIGGWTFTISADGY